MSKLAKTKSTTNQNGKAQRRHADRIARHEAVVSKQEPNHQHHKPGSMNARKSGR